MRSDRCEMALTKKQKKDKKDRVRRQKDRDDACKLLDNIATGASLHSLPP